jgi:hypothetical protein
LQRLSQSGRRDLNSGPLVPQTRSLRSGPSSAHRCRFAAGVSLFTLARRMGTSLEQIDKTYGHLLPDAEEYERGLLDAFDARADEAVAES